MLRKTLTAQFRVVCRPLGYHPLQPPPSPISQLTQVLHTVSITVAAAVAIARISCREGGGVTHAGAQTAHKRVGPLTGAKADPMDGAHGGGTQRMRGTRMPSTHAASVRRGAVRRGAAQIGPALLKPASRAAPAATAQICLCCQDASRRRRVAESHGVVTRNPLKAAPESRLETQPESMGLNPAQQAQQSLSGEGRHCVGSPPVHKAHSRPITVRSRPRLPVPANAGRPSFTPG